MKTDRYGQSAILSESDRLRIRRCLFSPSHKLLFDIACFTGERWGAIIKLRTLDCYYGRGEPKPRKEITFRGITRKRSRGKPAPTRQVPVHPTLYESLLAYPTPQGELMFPSPRNPGKPITYQNADKILRQAVERAGLSHRGISTHSTRRTFITRLSEAGIDIRTIQTLTGHASLQSLQRYIEESPERKQKAIHALSF